MESINTPKLDSHYYLFITYPDILFHNVTQFWFCFMSDDRVRCESIFSFGFFFIIYFVFFYSVQKMCTSTPLTYNNENKDSGSTSIAEIYLE